MVTPAHARRRDIRPAAGFWKAACLGVVSAALLTPSAWAGAQATAAGDLVNLINQYRQQNKLPAIPLSQKLTQVAIAHLEDLVNNHPDTKLCPANKQNMHSWSQNPGKWKGGCYDSANSATYPIMWDKPKEIAGYPNNGYEISEQGSSDAASALDSWKKSSAHNAVILNEGIWAQFPWKAIGAAQCQGYWCVWFGETLDTSNAPDKIVYYWKGYNDLKKRPWVSDLLAIDPSKVKKISSGGSNAGAGEDSSNQGKAGDASAPKVAPSGSRVSAGVHGRVYAMDPSGKLLGTVSEATIELKNEGGAEVSRITSGQNGYYRADLPAGRYFYKVTAPGYKDEDKGRGFTLQRTDEGQIYDFWLVKGENDPNQKPPEIPVVPIAKLKGTVWEKTEKGELVGIPKAVVSLRLAGSPTMAQVTTSSADKDGQSAGAYQIVLAQGNWQASVNAPGFEILVDPKAIEIVAGKEAIRDFVLERQKVTPPVGQGIKGVVRVEGARVGHLPEDIKVEILPIPAAKTIEPPSVDPAGAFRSDLAPGAYRVQARAAGYLPAISGVKYVLAGQYTAVTLVLRKEKPETPEMPQQPEIPGVVVPPGAVAKATLSVTVLGVDGGRRKPLDGAVVLVRHRDEDLAAAQRKTTGATGEADFEITRVGPHVALAQMKGYQPGGIALEIGPNDKLAKTITLEKRPQPEEPPPIEPPGPGEEAESVRVAGYVVYRDATSSTGVFGAAGARLTWHRVDRRQPQPPQSVRAGKVGEFDLVLPEGQYEIAFELPREFRPKQPERLVVKLGMKPMWFIVQKLPEESPVEPGVKPRPDTGRELLTVRGFVVVRSTQVRRGYAAVEGATIRWRPRAGEHLQPGVVRSDDRGRFSLQLSKGLYAAEVEPPPGYAPTARDIRVEEGMEGTMFVLARVERPKQPSPQQPAEPTPGTPQPPEQLGGGLQLQVMGRDSGKVFPLAGCQIRVTQGRRIVVNGGTDRNGRFNAPLANGSYEVTVLMNGFNTARTGVSVAGRYVPSTIYLDRQRAGPLQDPEPPQEPGGQILSLQVRVMVSFPRPPKQDRPGGFVTTPAGGASVTIVEGRRMVASGMTDGDGNYTARLRPGSYKINVAHGTLRGSEGVTLDRGNVSRTITLQSGALLLPPQLGPRQPDSPQRPFQAVPMIPLQVVPMTPLQAVPMVPRVE